MRDKILNYQQLECDYFNLYNQLLSVDFQISLFEKNHKSLIKEPQYSDDEICNLEFKYKKESLKWIKDFMYSLLI